MRSNSDANITFILQDNMYKKLKKKASLNYLNSKGWRTKRKIIVIESDDWGAIRMPNKEVYDRSLLEGIKVNQCPYNRYDTIANNNDFTALFSVLSKFKDKNNNAPIITTNTIMANPDFNMIASKAYKEYHYETFTKTIEDYYPGQNVFGTWEEGIHEKLIHPQFHGREHLYIKRWLKMLMENSKETIFTFENRYFGLSTNLTTEKRGTYLAALDFEDINEIEEQKEIIKDGLNIFKKIFNFDSTSFIAPNYTWHKKLEPFLKDHGIETIQGARAHLEPTIEGVHVKKHYMGEYSESKQIYLVRNVEFEPSLNNKVNWLNYVMSQIECAFFWNQPAVISSHRINFIGSLVEENRTNSLNIFEEILRKIIKKWPNVEFMTSDQLGELIRSKNG